MVEATLVEDILKQALLLQGQKITLKQEQDQIIEKVKKAKHWLAKEPDYLNFLKHLQRILHEKNIGAFSELLSYFVRDVLKKDKDIVMELYTYHNLPALKIESMNQGERENIVEGNGGSIANIVSTGLRLIALSRLPNRKFIILDEPDCWLKPEHIPIFAKIIGEISTQLNIQTVIISHHHWSYFKDYGRVIELKQEGPHLTTEIIHDTVVTKDMTSEDIIENITMRHFMSHHNTVYQLHPHLTCIVGENDIGKSVVATAMKALSYGESSDSYIQHHEKEAQVQIDLTGQRQILWQRFRETDQDNPQKVKYSIFHQGILTHSEFNSSEAPTFIQKELNICTVEDIDVHIGNQKNPVFLLSSATKPQERAKILSLGKDSLNIQKTMETIKSKKKMNRSIEKEGEARFAMIEQILRVLEDIEQLVQKAEALQSQYGQFAQLQSKIEEIEVLIEEFDFYMPIAQEKHITNINITAPVLYPLNEIEFLIKEITETQEIAHLSVIPNTELSVQYHALNDIDTLIAEIEMLQGIAQSSNIDIHVQAPVIHNLDEIEALINAIEELQHLKEANVINTHIVAPILYPLNDIEQLILHIEEQQQLIHKLKQEQMQAVAQQVNIEKEFDTYFEEYGHICPTCHQTASKEHLRGEHA